MIQTYITGSAIVSALGQNRTDAVAHMYSLNNKEYASYRKSVFKNTPFYSISDNNDKKTRFYTIIKQVILDALNDAGIPSNEYHGLSVFIGSSSMNISVTEQHWEEKGCFKDIGNGAISRFIDTLLQPDMPTSIFSTACTSSTNALIVASNEIKAGRIKRALVLGIEFFNDATYQGFNSLMLLSKTGTYMPLAPESDGLVLGEGCSAVVLESKPNAEDDFLILGSKNLFDNYSETSSNPDGKVIYNTMRNALNSSKLDIENLTLINIHSPGTEVSNESESNALEKLLYKNDHTYLKIPLISMKPYIGHTLGACSMNELVLLTAAVKEGFIPNTLGSTDTESFIFSTFHKLEKKEASILFSYNGFSGNNFSFVLSNKG